MAGVPFIFANQNGPIPLSELDANFNAFTGTSPGQGSDLLGFIQSGANATPRTMTQKARERYSVTDFAGCDPTGVTASDAAFASAVSNLPAAGGEIDVPNGTYQLNTAPTVGTKSIKWNIGSGCLFTGTVGGSTTSTGFPRAITNFTLVPFGEMVQVQTSAPTPLSLAAASGIFEALQPSTYNGDSVALYTGANGSSASGNVWSINCLIQANVGAGGTYQCIEADINCFTTTGIVKGIGISGVGTQNPTVALEILHQQKWKTGISIVNAITGMTISNSVTSGISIGGPGFGVGANILGRQLANAGETITLQRNTDTSPSGNFLHFVNAAGNTDLLLVDVNGDITLPNQVQAGFMKVTGAAPSTVAGQLGIGAQSGTTIGAAGGASPLPATPLNYIIWTLNGSTVKIPVYNP